MSVATQIFFAWVAIGAIKSLGRAVIIFLDKHGSIRNSNIAEFLAAVLYGDED